MDQSNNSVSSTSPNGSQDNSEGVGQDQAQQQAEQEVSIALNQTEPTTPSTAADGPYSAANLATSTEDAFGDTPVPGQADAPSLAPEDQPLASPGSQGTDGPSFAQPTPLTNPGSQQADPSQPAAFGGGQGGQYQPTAAQPGTGPDLNSGAPSANPAPVQTPFEPSQIDPSASQPVASTPQHADFKSVIILGVVAFVLIGAIAVMMFMK